jgi:hypothetical protein
MVTEAAANPRRPGARRQLPAMQPAGARRHAGPPCRAPPTGCRLHPRRAGHNIIFILRTVQGSVSLAMTSPQAAAGAGVSAQRVYTTSAAEEQYLFIPSSQVEALGGREFVVTLSHKTPFDTPFYTLTVLTPSAGLMLAQEQAAALGDIHAACCSSASFGTDTLCAKGWGARGRPGCSAGARRRPPARLRPALPALPLQRALLQAPRRAAPDARHPPPRPGPPRRTLLAAAHPQRTAVQDICNQPPFVCNEKGELLRFIAPSAGFACKGLPEAFANLSSLQSLDLSANVIVDTAAHVGKVGGAAGRGGAGGGPGVLLGAGRELWQQRASRPKEGRRHRSEWRRAAAPPLAGSRSCARGRGRGPPPRHVLPQVVSQLADLRRLYLRSCFISGPLTCDLVPVERMEVRRGAGAACCRPLLAPPRAARPRWPLTRPPLTRPPRCSRSPPTPSPVPSPSASSPGWRSRSCT